MEKKRPGMDGKQFAQILEMAEPGTQLDLVVTGSSMHPFLLSGQSVVRLQVRFDAKVGDIVFFDRGNHTLILHRVIKELPEGRLLICGDRQTWTETIHRDQILAIVVGIRRRDKFRPVSDWGYRLLVRIWMWLKPVRPEIYTLVAHIKGLF